MLSTKKMVLSSRSSATMAKYYGLYYTPKMLSALGYSPGFPVELQLNPVVPVANLSIPATPFHESPRALKDGLIKQKIYVTPTECFDVTFRDVFRDHISGVEFHKWLPSRNMDYWQDQLNFTVWCATMGCGIATRILFEDKETDQGLVLPSQVKSFFWSHVSFTVRRVLFALGGIQSVLALPGDPTFQATENHYDRPSYERLCREFGIEASSCFRFNHDPNHGLGSSLHLRYT